MTVNKNIRRAGRHPAYLARGVTLIELMIALLLGLVVSAVAGGIFLANKRVYASTETLNRIQENTRVSFEIMARDLREAGGNPCGGGIPIVSQLVTGENSWWTEYADGLHGYPAGVAAPGTTSGAGAAQRVADTDAVDLHLANSGDIRVTSHTTPSSVLDVTSTDGISDGDILMVCNSTVAMVFQATGVAGGGLKIQHDGGGGPTEGNCGNEFQYKRNCASGASGAFGYCFLVPAGASSSAQCAKHARSPATVVQVQSFRWYIGNNGGGGRSLYRATLINENDLAVPTVDETVEIAEGVIGMELRYRSNGLAAFQAAGAIANWAAVNAVQVNLTVTGVEGALQGNYIEGTDGQALSRDLTYVVALRNKEGVL
ncbi:PilW family protein [Lysobacter sp. A289]